MHFNIPGMISVYIHFPLSSKAGLVESDAFDESLLVLGSFSLASGVVLRCVGSSGEICGI